MDSANIYSNHDGQCKLRMPGEIIYQKERIPFVFQNERMGGKMTSFRNKIERNISEAAFNTKHRPSTGVLSIARRNATVVNKRSVKENSSNGFDLF
jgi:hypothetical protein